MMDPPVALDEFALRNARLQNIVTDNRQVHGTPVQLALAKIRWAFPSKARPCNVRDAIYRSELAALRVKIRIIALTTSLSELILTSVIPRQCVIHQSSATAAGADPRTGNNRRRRCARLGTIGNEKCLEVSSELKSEVSSILTDLTCAGHNQADREYGPNVKNEYSDERSFDGTGNVLPWVLRLSHRNTYKLGPDVCKQRGGQGTPETQKSR